MGESAIEWTRYTFNPWRGCTKVSEGCKNCYAEKNMSVKLHGIGWGPDAERVVKAESGWKVPLQWNRRARLEGRMDRVFCGSLMDICEDRDELNASRARVFELAEQTPNLFWLFLTKRPENILSMKPRAWRPGYSGIPKNVGFGSTMENQKYADERGTQLAKLNCFTFASAEPLLEALDLRRWSEQGLECAFCGWKGCEETATEVPEDGDILYCCPGCKEECAHTPIDEYLGWIITGGESGYAARTSQLNWFRSLRNQCVSSNLPFFFKQWGEYCNFDDLPEDTYQAVDASGAHPSRTGMVRVGKKAAGCLLDGREWKQVPEIIR